MFGEKPKKTRIPLVAGDHPETDLSEFCDQDQIKQFQMVVGQLIWITGLGRFDIVVHVMTKSKFRHQPRVGYLARLKGIIGYLANFPHRFLRFRTNEPDYSNLPHKEYDWQRTVYSGAKEEVLHHIIVHLPNQTLFTSQDIFVISQPISSFTQQYFNHIYFLHTHIHGASHICCMNLWAYGTKNQMQVVCGSHEISQSILTLTPQNYHYHDDHISI